MNSFYRSPEIACNWWLAGGCLVCAIIAAGCGSTERKSNTAKIESSKPNSAGQITSLLPEKSGKEDAEEPTGDWPVWRGNAQCSGVAASTLPQSLKIRWEVTVPKNSFTSTACLVEIDGKKMAVLASGSGPIVALDLSDGHTLWEFEGPLGFIGSVACFEGRFYAGDVDGVFYCLDRHGKEVWKFAAEGSIDASPNFHGAHVLFTSQDTNLYCLRADSGELVWKVAAGDQLRSTPTVAGDRAFVAGCDGLLRVINLNDGSEVGSVELESQTGCTPAAEGDLIYFGTQQSGFFAVNWREPKLVWKFNPEENPISVQGNAAVIDGHVLFGSVNRQFFSLDAKSGEVQWQVRTKANLESSAVVVGQSVFVGSKNGLLTEYNWKDGEEKNSYELNGALTGSPAVGFGRIVVATERGSVYCLGD